LGCEQVNAEYCYCGSLAPLDATCRVFRRPGAGYLHVIYVDFCAKSLCSAREGWFSGVANYLSQDKSALYPSVNSILLVVEDCFNSLRSLPAVAKARTRFVQVTAPSMKDKLDYCNDKASDYEAISV
jgi:hypothetical protein